MSFFADKQYSPLLFTLLMGILWGVEGAAPYKKMYYTLFNSITDAVRLLEENKLADASLKLLMAQHDAEELYISAEE